MEWENIPADIENWLGFVYLIERLNAKEGERKYYWGCKQFKKKVTRKPLKGKVNRRRSVAESDWREYYGSSKELLKDIELHGKDQFKRTILKMCKSKWQLKFEELNYQIANKVLLRDDSYNGIINLRIGKVPTELRAEYNWPGM